MCGHGGGAWRVEGGRRAHRVQPLRPADDVPVAAPCTRALHSSTSQLNRAVSDTKYTLNTP